MIGEIILHYKILEKLGEGGMGVVYKAEDTELKRYVALKFLPTNISSSSEEAAMLKLEAQAAAMLNHPNICTVYAIEEEKNGRFISMEYMDGITLRKKVADGPLAIGEGISYAIQISEALNEAHKKGMIHRDIKTENIMINAKNQVKVMDFGLAALKNSITESSFNGTFGTLAYLSPEQTLNKPPGFTSDIWSYGIVCYEMFTGRLPFFDEYEAAIIYSILNEEPIPPSHIRLDIPLELESIILKCMQKEEENRYQSAEQIVHDLRKLNKEIEVQSIREDFKKEHHKKEKKAAEQKQAAIVYMQIQNYQELSGLIGQENMVGMLESYYQVINYSAQKYGGTVNKTNTGEAVLYFGLPEAIENSSQKALRAVIEIKEGFISIRKEYGISDLYNLNIAVSSGTVIAGSISSGDKFEYTVLGDAVEIALALLGSAVNGRILVNSITYKILKDVFEFKQLKSISLKGRRDPVEVYELLIDGINFKSDNLQTTRLIKSEIVGRADELNRLENLIINSKNGQGSVVSIIADAGIGKSRIINELKKKDIIKQVILLEGKAESTEKNVSYHPVTGILKQWAQIHENDNESQAFTKLENSIRSLFNEETGEVLPFIAALMGFRLKGDYEKRIADISSEALSKLIQKSMRELILKGSEVNPIVFIIEDLHWADQSSIELLQSLFRLAENNRLLFICTLRPNYHETGDKMISAIKERYAGFYTEIKLESLNVNDCLLLLENLLKMKSLPEKIKESVLKNTEGNPFFIEEVIRSLIDDNIIEINNGQFIVSHSVEDIVVPVSIKDVLLARIDKLDENVKYTLKVASVIGRYFLYEVLKKVMDNNNELEKNILTLIKLELIRENKDKSEREYLFYHALAQEAVYDTLLSKNRQELHLKVADAIESVFEEKTGDYFEVLAHHYSLGDDKEKAEKYLIKAGEKTLKNAASSEALNYFNEALNLYIQKYGANVDKGKIFMLEKNIGMLFYNKGYFEDSIEHFGKALSAIDIKTERSDVGELLRLAANFSFILMKLYLQVFKPKRKPSARDYELFDIYYKTANAYANLNGKKMFFWLMDLLKMKLGFVLTPEDGFETYAFGSSLFTYSGLSFSLGEIFLERAKTIARVHGIDDIYNMSYDESIFITLSGNWKNFTKINERLLDLKLRAGDLFGATYQISWALYIIIGKGKYDYAEYLINKGDEIADTYDFDYGKLYMLSFKADLELSKRNLHKAISYYNDTCLLAEKLGLTSWILGLSGKRTKAYILLNDYASAKDSINKAEQASLVADSLTPMLLSYFYAYKLFYHVNLFKKSQNDVLQDEIKLHEKEILHRWKSVLKISNKVAEIKPEVNMIVGKYYLCKNKFRKAHKYFLKSIAYAEHLEELPELGRSYLEFGKFLSDPRVRIKNKNPEKYFTEAEKIFEALNLQWDLNELKRIRNFQRGNQN